MSILRCLAHLPVLALISCTIPIAGKVELKSQAPTIVVGKTTFSEIQTSLGKPKSNVVIEGRRYARWDWARVKIAPITAVPVAGSFTDSNAGVYQWLSIEAGADEVVRRKLFYENQQAIRQTLAKTQLGTPYEVIKNADAYRNAKSSAELIRTLGAPLRKEVSPKGEKWVWVGAERGFVNRNGMVTAFIDAQGRALEIWRKVD
jgi:hypothetical protein